MRRLPDVRCLVILAGLTLLSLNFAAGQQRYDRPIQLQIDLGGAFAGTTARIDNGNEFSSIDRGTWRPGLQAGVHLTRFIYVGISHRPSTRFVRVQPFGFGSEKDAVAEFRFREGATQTLSVRLSPIKPGLFLSADASFTASTKSVVEALPSGSSFQYGETTVRYFRTRFVNPAYRALAVGLGYTHVTRTGPSLTIGAYRKLSSAPGYVRFPYCCPSPAEYEMISQGLANAGIHSRLVIYANIGVNFFIAR